VSVFLSLVVVAAAVVGIVSGVRNAKTLAKYKGAYLTEAETSFFASYAKYNLMSRLTGESDTPEFWESKTPYGTKYREVLEYETKQLIKEIVAANYLFDKYSSLTSADKKEINAATEEVIKFHMENDRGKFDAEAEKHGFSYSDYSDIVTKIYKYNKAYSAFESANAASIRQDSKAVLDYYAEYSKVKLIFINTEKDYKLDEKGNRVIENDDYVLVDISEEEKQKREADIAEISTAIANWGTDEAFQMSELMFENYLKKYPSAYYGDKNTNGFYFHADSYYTAWFEYENPEVIREVLTMNEGFKEVKTKYGVCFIYKDKVNINEMPYLDTSNDSCFSDFYSNLVIREFAKTVEELSGEVEIRDAYSQINLVALPKLNYLFVPRF
jgi:hypothetical protein